MTRTGKIARLPRALRDELNHRLEQNLPGSRIVAWLNALPETKAVLDSLFEGRPVSEQNLSEWRNGGFLEWQTRGDLLEEVRESAHDAAALHEAAPLMADRAAQILTARFFVAARNWNGDPDDPAFSRLKRLSSLLRNLNGVRRSEHNAAKLHMQQYTFDLARKTRDPLPPDEAPNIPSPSSTHLSDLPPTQATIQPLPRRPADGSPPPFWHPDDLPPTQATIQPLPRRPADGSPPLFWHPDDAPLPAPHQTASNHIKPLSPEATPENTTPAPSSKPQSPKTSAPSTSSVPSVPSPTPPETPVPASDWLSTFVPEFPSPSSPVPNPAIPPAIVTSENVTIPPSPPKPLTDAELWQMRSRPLPGESEPAWRIQLPIKTIPPWQRTA